MLKVKSEKIKNIEAQPKLWYFYKKQVSTHLLVIQQMRC